MMHSERSSLKITRQTSYRRMLTLKRWLDGQLKIKIQSRVYNLQAKHFKLHMVCLQRNY